MSARVPPEGCEPIGKEKLTPDDFRRLLIHTTATLTAAQKLVLLEGVLNVSTDKYKILGYAIHHQDVYINVKSDLSKEDLTMAMDSLIKPLAVLFEKAVKYNFPVNNAFIVHSDPHFQHVIPFEKWSDPTFEFEQVYIRFIFNLFEAVDDKVVLVVRHEQWGAFLYWVVKHMHIVKASTKRGKCEPDRILLEYVPEDFVTLVEVPETEPEKEANEEKERDESAPSTSA